MLCPTGHSETKAWDKGEQGSGGEGHEEGHLAFHQLEGSPKQGGEVPLPPFPGPLGMAVMVWG